MGGSMYTTRETVLEATTEALRKKLSEETMLKTRFQGECIFWERRYKALERDLRELAERYTKREPLDPPVHFPQVPGGSA